MAGHTIKRHATICEHTYYKQCDTVPEIHRSVSEPQSKCEDRESADQEGCEQSKDEERPD